ncbi:hypothetical protein C8D85_1586 [Marinomonas communis]|uniref:Uncharacterized protein n=1 Tax=Marinomonas communis TaxID=28254 RepID=A0A4R6XB06_9GAMM|nr:hypothetical protein C8D85_1586 [Marinomonas communis]
MQFNYLKKHANQMHGTSDEGRNIGFCTTRLYRGAGPQPRLKAAKTLISEHWQRYKK